MDRNDLFLKVEVTAYFPINGLNIDEREFPDDIDKCGIYYNNEHIIPEVIYYIDRVQNNIHYQEQLPDSMPLEIELLSRKESIISRAEMSEEEHRSQLIDELIEKSLNEIMENRKISEQKRSIIAPEKSNERGKSQENT